MTTAWSIKAITNDTTEVRLESKNICAVQAQVLAHKLERCENLRVLDLDNNNIDTAGAKAIAKVLKKRKNLTELHLKQNNLGEEGVKAVANALKDCDSLSVLNTSGNNIGTEGAKAIAEVLKGCKNLTELFLYQNNLGEEGIKAVANALKDCDSLSVLGIGGNNIGTEGAKAIAEVLKGCKNLTKLYLRDNKIGPEGAKAIANALEGCENLTLLNLQQNNIGSEGAKAIAEVLKGCKNLTKLYLELNSIGIDGTKAIAKSLHKTCPNVKTWCDFGYDLTPKELFAKVCTLGEGIAAPDSDSGVCIDEVNEPCAKPKNSKNAILEVPDMAGVSFADVVQPAKEVSHTRAGCGVAREDSLQTAIALFEEFAGPVIQGYLVQEMLAADITKSKERLESCQARIRESIPAGLSQLIAEWNDERTRLHLLVQSVYPWVRTGFYESNKVQVRGFKERLSSLLQELGISRATLVGRACTADFKDCQALLGRADKCVKEYKASQSSRQRNASQRSEEAMERLILRMSELRLDDEFRVAMREPEKATRLKPEPSELQNALQEELEDLKGDTLRDTVIEALRDIVSALNALENSTQDFKVDEAISLSLDDIEELYDFMLW